MKWTLVKICLFIIQNWYVSPSLNEFQVCRWLRYANFEHYGACSDKKLFYAFLSCLIPQVRFKSSRLIYCTDSQGAGDEINFLRNIFRFLCSSIGRTVGLHRIFPELPNGFLVYLQITNALSYNKITKCKCLSRSTKICSKL